MLVRPFTEALIVIIALKIKQQHVRLCDKMNYTVLHINVFEEW